MRAEYKFGKKKKRPLRRSGPVQKRSGTAGLRLLDRTTVTIKSNVETLFGRVNKPAIRQTIVFGREEILYSAPFMFSVLFMDVVSDKRLYGVPG